MILVLSGPGGAGKGTVAKRLIERNPNIDLSRSWTTRPCRKDEALDAYTFVDEQTFMAEIEADNMLEWIKFGGYYYGTPKSELEASSAGRIILLEIDVQGAKKVLELYPERVKLVFLEAPNLEAQRKRLQKRGDSQDHVVDRIERADQEREEAKKLQATWIINEDVEKATEEIEEILKN